MSFAAVIILPYATDVTVFKGHPGVQVAITQKGLETLAELMVQRVTDLLTGKPIFYCRTLQDWLLV